MSFIDQQWHVQHTVALGTWVRYRLREPHAGYLRMVVVEHSRDCDGTPLYMLAERAVGKPPDGPLYGDEYLRYRLHAGFFVGNVGINSIAL